MKLVAGRQVGACLVLAGVLALGWGAAGAATSQRAVFKVTLTATLTKDWTISRVVAGECTETTRTKGNWRLTLRTTRPSTIAFRPSGRGRPPRIGPALVRSLAGRATQDGSVRVLVTGPACPGPTFRDCAQRRATFRGGSARLTSPTRGVARFARTTGIRPARSLSSSCPEEPADVRALRTDLSLATAPLGAGDVFDRRVTRFFISANSTQQTTISGQYDGTVTERVRWTLTFTRVR